MGHIKIVEPVEGQLVTFVGVHVLDWAKVVSGEITRPTVGFLEVSDDDSPAQPAPEVSDG